jgi:histidinol-phosphate aminotransferase
MNATPAMQHTMVHGGPDEIGVARYDFSTNANACGPCPQVLHALGVANPAHYPDPNYTHLKQSLAKFHQVEPTRVLLAGSASEFIFRITCWAKQQGFHQSIIPQVSYGDYLRAANAADLATLHIDNVNADANSNVPVRLTDRTLVWACDPSSPFGRVSDRLATYAASKSMVVLDRAYEPLRLQGQLEISAELADRVWQLWSPNKALGVTGVRGAYAIAPLLARQPSQQIDALAASWPIGAHGVAMLALWTQPEVQLWLAATRDTLRDWKIRQIAHCELLDWLCLPSVANFFTVVCKQALPLQALRIRNIKVRDCTSFGLSHHYRLGVLAPDAQDALLTAMRAIR